MKKIDLKNLKKIQLEILDEVALFCKKNNINYWIDCGTLLGAIRHKGYIPWDDDIDVGMLREDYDKFMELFNKNNDKYKFYSIENNKKFNYPYGKVLDTSTVLYEPDEKHGKKLWVNIDIFVYDNAPENIKQQKKMFKKRDIYNIFNSVKVSPYATSRKGGFTNIVRYPCHYILKLLPVGFFSKKIINNSKEYMNNETKYVGNFTSYKKLVADREIFKSFVEVDFEGKKYKAPIGYDKWLTLFYGDYMKLPPKEKQVSTHKFVAYKLNND